MALAVTITFLAPMPGERVVTRRSFTLGPKGDVEAGTSGSVRVIVRRRDRAVIVRPIDGGVSVNGHALTGPVVLGPTDSLDNGTLVRIVVAGEAAPRRWWNPRDWRDDDEDAPPAPARQPTANPPYPRVVGNPPMFDPTPVWVPPQPVVHDVLSGDPTEDAFLVTLRARPDDEATLMVYADWLETEGRPDDANAVRGTARPGPATLNYWRAIACDEAIRGCTDGGCPARWRKLVPIADDEMSRTCPACNRRVYHNTPLPPR